MKNLSVKSSLIASVALVLILVSSVGATAALAAPFPSSAGSAITPDHHKPDHDKGNGNGNKPEKDKGKPDDRSNSGKGKGIGNSPMLKPVPAALGDFELAANGTAIAKRDGRDGPFTDASLVLQATVIREEGNHLRFHATGTVELKGEGEYDIIDAKGIIIFFKNPRGNAVSGLIHIAGKHAVDQDGSDLGKFKLRALVLGQLTDSSWKIIVFPSGKLGKEFLLVNMSGKIDGITGGPNPPPGSLGPSVSRNWLKLRIGGVALRARPHRIRALPRAPNHPPHDRTQRERDHAEKQRCDRHGLIVVAESWSEELRNLFSKYSIR